MQPLTLVLLAGVLAAALAAGQYYVPRAYYTIDDAGHQTAPVPLRRLRRSPPLRANIGSSANANANANAWSNGSGGSSATANANANAGSGNWYPGGGGAGVSYPGSGNGWAGNNGGGYGASGPAVGSGAPVTFVSSGPVRLPSGGGGVSISTAAGLDGSGRGYYGTQTGFYPPPAPAAPPQS